MAINLSPELEQRLIALAQREGQTVEALLENFLSQHPASTDRRDNPFRRFAHLIAEILLSFALSTQSICIYFHDHFDCLNNEVA